MKKYNVTIESRVELIVPGDDEDLVAQEVMQNEEVAEMLLQNAKVSDIEVING